MPHLAAYAAGKFALTGFSEGLQAELAKSGIYVTTVTPGLMRTGSYVKVQLRGQHEKELRWFAGLADSPLISMQASRAARQIIEATRRGRAAITPLWYARAAQIVDAVAPNTFAAVTSLVDRTALPSPDAGPDAARARRATEVDPGVVKTTLSEERRRRYHQPAPEWGWTRHQGHDPQSAALLPVVKGSECSIARRLRRRRRYAWCRRDPYPATCCPRGVGRQSPRRRDRTR